jgi:hypothetical protein
MAFRREIDKSIGDLQLTAIRAFLRANGYTYRERWGGYLERFSRKMRSREENVLIPSQRDISDFERRVAEALDALSRQLEIPYDTLIRNVANSNYEIIRIRVNEGNDQNTIPYDTTMDLLKGGFALIDSSAALTVSHEHLPIIRGRRPDVVRRYLDDVRVGQTEVGSFVLTLLMPMGVDMSGLELPAHLGEGFGSRVSETFASSLTAAEEAVRAPRPLPNRTLINNGVTANFSGGIARMLEAVGDVSIGLSKFAGAQNLSKGQTSRFSSADAEKLRDIEQRLTPKENEEPFTATGTIVVNCDVHGEQRQVRTRFERGDRPTVVHAIEQKAQVFVEIDGYLISKSGHFQLERPTNFRTVPRGPLA